jgi:hypothetical protein
MCGGGVNELKKGDRMSFHCMLISFFFFFLSYYQYIVYLISLNTEPIF